MSKFDAHRNVDSVKQGTYQTPHDNPSSVRNEENEQKHRPSFNDGRCNEMRLPNPAAITENQERNARGLNNGNEVVAPIGRRLHAISVQWEREVVIILCPHVGRHELLEEDLCEADIGLLVTTSFYRLLQNRREKTKKFEAILRFPKLHYPRTTKDNLGYI